MGHFEIIVLVYLNIAKRSSFIFEILVIQGQNGTILFGAKYTFVSNLLDSLAWIIIKLEIASCSYD